MNRAGDRHHHFAIREQTIALQVAGNLAWIGELLLDLFVFWQSQYILTRANEGDDKRAFQRRLAQSLDQHAIGGAVEAFEVVGNLRPAGDGAIVTRLEAEHGLRRRNDSRLRRGSLGERRYTARGKQQHQRHAGD